MANSPSGESLMGRAVRVIETFSEDESILTVSEIAKRAELPITTAHRIVNELVDLRILARDTERKIRLGTRLWEISQRASYEMRLRTTALPVMQHLQSIVKSHVQLAVISHGQVLYLERLSMPGAVKNTAHPASRIEAHFCSPGLILLAYAPPEVQLHAFEGEFVRNTPTSIRNGDELRSRLAEARKQRFAVSNGMLVPTSKGVAVPIVAEGQRVVAALSVVIPLDSDHQQMVPIMMRASQAISAALGSDYVSDDSAWITQSLEAGQEMADAASGRRKGEKASQALPH